MSANLIVRCARCDKPIFMANLQFHIYIEHAREKDRALQLSDFYFLLSDTESQLKGVSETSNSSDSVNHPVHYNSHPSGVECITVIRHMPADIAAAVKYLWRQGLKPEEGKTELDKAIEDCSKAIWYIQDYIDNILKPQLAKSEKSLDNSSTS